jgi:hypothetical protein
MSMSVITDDLWSEISRGASYPDGTPLPDEARPEVEDWVAAYREWPAQERVTRPTKELLADVLSFAVEFRGKLEQLATNKEYLQYNIKGLPASLELLGGLKVLIDQLPPQLEADKNRFAKRGARNMERKWRVRLARGLLEIRCRHLNAPYPRAPVERKLTGRFKTYLTLCLRCAGVSEHEIDDTIGWACYVPPTEPKKQKRREGLIQGK